MSHLGLPYPKLAFYKDHPLSPWIRLTKLLKCRELTKKGVIKFIKGEILKWTQDTTHIKGGDGDYIQYLKENVNERKQTEDVLQLHWMLSRLKGETSKFLFWHITGTFDLHVNCLCSADDVDKKKYYPKDELMTILLVYIFKKL